MHAEEVGIEDGREEGLVNSNLGAFVSDCFRGLRVGEDRLW